MQTTIRPVLIAGSANDEAIHELPSVKSNVPLLRSVEYYSSIDYADAEYELGAVKDWLKALGVLQTPSSQLPATLVELRRNLNRTWDVLKSHHRVRLC